MSEYNLITVERDTIWNLDTACLNYRLSLLQQLKAQNLINKKVAFEEKKEAFYAMKQIMNKLEEFINKEEMFAAEIVIEDE
jgi:hypothetical protein